MERGPSFNELAENQGLPAWASWREGTPPGFFRNPLGFDSTDFYRNCGFMVVENALSPEDIAAITSETLAIVRGERGEMGGFEPQTGLTDDESLARVLCVHFPHKISRLIAGYLGHPGITDALQDVIGQNVKCMQSMLFVKASGKPGQAWHQDEIYIPTRDRSLTGVWIALDDATVENGCLWVIPGSHRRGILYNLEWHADPRFDCAHEARGFPWSNDEAVPVEVKAGSAVIFNGYLLHRSLPNYSTGHYRRALVNHYMSAESLLPWGAMAEGAYPAIADNRDIVIVAGTDPYAHKGIEDRNRPHIRPSGEGGCGSFQYNEKP